jgi:hypothetical protein
VRSSRLPAFLEFRRCFLIFDFVHSVVQVLCYSFSNL